MDVVRPSQKIEIVSHHRAICLWSVAVILEPSSNSLSKMIEAKGEILISAMLLKSPLTLQLVVDGGQLYT